MAIAWQEIELPTSWGTIRGKQCGTGKRKVLGVHGWLDNANTFDCILPLLKYQSFSFVSIDLPGHGKSDHFNSGFIYDPRGYVAAVKKAVTSLQWNKFTYVGHSMGALVGIMYTSVFPEDVDSFVSIDIIKCWSIDSNKYSQSFRRYFDSYFSNEEKCSLTPILYNKEELISKAITGSGNSLDAASAAILLERGTLASGDGFCLTRDLRAKTYFIGFIHYEAWLGIAAAIKCPVLIVKALSGKCYESAERYTEMLAAFAQDCPLYRYHEMDGHHHVHMTRAKHLAPVLQTFLDDTEQFIENFPRPAAAASHETENKKILENGDVHHVDSTALLTGKLCETVADDTTFYG